MTTDGLLFLSILSSLYNAAEHLYTGMALTCFYVSLCCVWCISVFLFVFPFLSIDYMYHLILNK